MNATLSTQQQNIINEAKAILALHLTNSNQIFTMPKDVKDFLVMELAQESSEVFGVMFLSTRHQLIEFRRMFFGTIDSASVHPREVVKAALATNAAAVIFAHNHPSAIAQASRADVVLTERLQKILEIIDVRVLDHIIVAGADTVSFQERGLL